jgi:hypothetical protein
MASCVSCETRRPGPSELAGQTDAAAIVLGEALDLYEHKGNLVMAAQVASGSRSSEAQWRITSTRLPLTKTGSSPFIP